MSARSLLVMFFCLLAWGRHMAPAAPTSAAQPVARPWPPGAWEYVLPVPVIDRGLFNVFCSKNLTRILQRAQGGQLRIGLLGGSFSMPSRDCFLTQFVEALQRWYPQANITGANGAQGGTNSGYALICMKELLKLEQDPRLDMVVVEYNINDNAPHAGYNDKRARVWERLIRQLASLPGSPLVVAVHFLRPRDGHKMSLDAANASYIHSVEDHVAILAQYYGIPWISHRAAWYHLQKAGARGFTSADIRYDGLHYNRLGHTYTTDFLMRLLERAAACDPATALDLGPLPETLLPNNPDTSSFACVQDEGLLPFVTNSTGWAFEREGRAGLKPGLIARTPGSSLQLTVNYTIDSPVAVYFAHLKSYEGMGKVRLECLAPCVCGPARVVSGHWDAKLSLTFTETLAVPSGRCSFLLTVLNETDSQGHKFKLSGLMVREAGAGGEVDEVNRYFMHEGKKLRL